MFFLFQIYSKIFYGHGYSKVGFVMAFSSVIGIESHGTPFNDDNHCPCNNCPFKYCPFKYCPCKSGAWSCNCGTDNTEAGVSKPCNAAKLAHGLKHDKSQPPEEGRITGPLEVGTAKHP